MRKMGIDYGHKKVGIALSDESGTMAFPRAVLPNDNGLLKAIEQLIVDESVGMVVIGHSLGRDGAPNPIHEAVTEFITDLTLATGVPVYLEPEQYTSAAAARLQGKNEMTDAAAAALILDSFIQKNKTH